MHTKRKAAAAHIAGTVIPGASEANLLSNDPEATLHTPSDDDFPGAPGPEDSMQLAMAAPLGLHEVQKTPGMSASLGDPRQLPTTQRQLALPQHLERVPASPGKWPLEPSKVDQPGSENITLTKAELENIIAARAMEIVAPGQVGESWLLFRLSGRKSIHGLEVLGLYMLGGGLVRYSTARGDNAPPRQFVLPLLYDGWVPDRSLDLEPRQVIHLNCLVFGDYPTCIFSVEIASTKTILDLREMIKDKNRHTFQQTDAKNLILWKVSVPDDGNLQANLDKLQVDFVIEKSLLPTNRLFEVFSESLVLSNHVHIIVKSLTPDIVPVTVTKGEHIDSFLQRLRPEIKRFLSHPRHPFWMPPDKVDENTRKFYYKLAIPSIYDKPNLLLHNLGDKINPNEDVLFRKDPNHRILCDTSGSGKTALIFNGLCSHWGFYFSVAQDANEIGARDLELAIEIMSQYKEWIKDVFENPRSNSIQNATNGNETIVYRWVCKVLLTRWYLFRTFIEVAKEQNAGNLPNGIKQDWLLFQILPSVLIDNKHPFLAFMNSCLLGMSMEDLRHLLNRFTPRGVLGDAFDSKSDDFFYVLDEAQVAGKQYMGAFADANGEIRRPVLQPIIKAWSSISSQSIRFIVSGTGFPLDPFQTVLTSGVGKAKPSWTVVHRTGKFNNEDPQK